MIMEKHKMVMVIKFLAFFFFFFLVLKFMILVDFVG